MNEFLTAAACIAAVTINSNSVTINVDHCNYYTVEYIINKCNEYNINYWLESDYND